MSHLMSNPAPPPTHSISDSRYFAIALGLLGVILFSLTLPMTKVALTAFTSVEVTLCRLTLASVIATFILAWHYGYSAVPSLPTIRPNRRELGYVVMSGIGIIIGFPLCTALALQTVPSSHAAISLTILPIMTAIVATLGGFSTHHSWRFWAIAVATTLMVLGYCWSNTHGELAWGDGWLLLAALTAGVGYAYAGRAAQTLGGIAAICWTLVLYSPWIIATTIMAWLMGWIDPHKLTQTLSPTVIGALLYVSLISQLGGFFVWNTALAKGGIAKISQLQLLQTFFTLFFGTLLLGEHLHWADMVMTACTVAGIVLMRRA